jgi:hypothetical protein
MKITYDNLVKWLDSYFETFNKYQGTFESVKKIGEYLSPDLEFHAYNLPGGMTNTRDGLLLSMVHPGLHEHITPHEYLADVKKLIVVIFFEAQFSDIPSGKVWPVRQFSAHYHLGFDDNNELKIKKVYFFSEHRPAEESGYRELWLKYREQALAERRLSQG